MTRAHHVTHSSTSVRIERMCTLIAALQIKPLTRAGMAGVLQMGPSGVRKYLGDLVGKFEWAHSDGEEVCRLTINEAEARAFMAGLAATAAARPINPAKTALSIAARDPSRRFHIMQDDEHYSIRISRAPVVRDPLVAALFGVGRLEARA